MPTTNDPSPAERIYLSPPHMGGAELEHVKEAFVSNWLAPVGPHLLAFESEVAELLGGTHHPVALSSGTAAIHLALRLVGVQAGDEVVCSTLTFVASAAPALYQGAKPVYVDSETCSWNMDPELLEDFLETRKRKGRIPKAVVVTDLYGQCADYGRIAPLCERFGVALIEDAAEALGATCNGKAAGTFGEFGVFSFNGNKIITTTAGGMLVSRDAVAIDKARFLATQARDPAAHYEHTEWGYNYRMSNVLAGIGRGQLSVLSERVAARRAVYQRYVEALADLPGVAFMPEAPWGQSNRWLTCLTVDPKRAPVDCQQLLKAFERENVEARPVWKPLHLQPVFRDCECIGGAVAEGLFARGLCLPSGSSLSLSQQARVIDVLCSEFANA